MKKHFAVLLCTIMLFTAVVGCSNNNAGGNVSQKDSVVVYVSDIFSMLNPFATTANSDQYIFNQVYETLAVVDDNGKVNPCLAESWEISEDALTYTFHLVEGAKFHNDEELKASDVVFTFNMAKKYPGKKNFIDMVESVEALDEYTVCIKLNKPTPLFLVYLHEVPIMNEKFVTEAGEAINETACGTGPYKLVEIDFATAAKLTRFDDYRLEPAAIKDVELRYISDASSAVIALEAGEVHFMDVVPSMVGTLLENPNFNHDLRQPLNTSVISVNTTVPPLDNKLVRQALTYACDKQSMIDIAYEGYAVPARLQANTNCFGVDFSDATDFSYNPEKAKELLAEAGYPDGFDFADFGITMDVLGGSFHEKIAQVFQQNLADIGVKLELRNTATPDEDAQSGNFALMNQGLSYRADFSYNVCHYGTVGLGGNNFSQMSDPWVDEMFKKGELETDPEKRKAIYKELIEYLVDYCPSIPIFHRQMIYVWAKDLNAVAHDSTVHPYYIYEWSWN